MRALDTITPGALVRLEGEAIGAPAYAEVISRRGTNLRVRWHGHEYLAAGAVVLGADDAARPVVAPRRFEPWQVATDRRQPRSTGGDPATAGGAPKVSAEGTDAPPQEFRGADAPEANLPGDPVTTAGEPCEGEACCHDPPAAPDAPTTARGGSAP